MTEDDSIEEIQALEATEEDEEKQENIALSRRTAQDVELDVDGEIIRMPCYDVPALQRRFQKETPEAESPAGSGLNRAKETVEQIASIAP